MQTLDAGQLTCLASQVRREVFTSLRAMGEGSAKEIADALNRKVELVHYHLKALEKAGLVLHAGKRSTARKPELLYKPAAEAFRLPDPQSSPELGEATRKAVAAGLRQATRGYETAAREPHLRKHISVIQAVIRLREEDAERFIEMIAAANRFARDAKTQDGISLQWSSVVYPDARHHAHRQESDP